MKVFAISDLHLSAAVEKPMNIFGDGWENHFDKIAADWKQKVSEEDLVLLGGDMSWGMNIAQAKPDYELVAALPGIKIVGKGNHDYYWNSLNKMRENFGSFRFLQNNAFFVYPTGEIKERFEASDIRSKKQREQTESDGAKIIVAGSRGWNIPDKDSEEADVKIYEHELARLETSLKTACENRNEGDMTIALLHYPPFGADYGDTEVTALLDKYKVDFALYGHLHGKNVRVTKILKKHSTTYVLTSCDLVDNSLVYITSL